MTRDKRVSQYRKCGRFLAKVTRRSADARGIFESQARVFRKNLAMNRSVEQVAKRFVDGNKRKTCSTGCRPSCAHTIAA